MGQRSRNSLSPTMCVFICLQVGSDDRVVVHPYVRISVQQRRCLRSVVQLSHHLLVNLSVHLCRASAVPGHDAVGQQGRVGVMVGARGGGDATDVTRAGGATSAAGGAAFRRGQVVLDDPGGRHRRREVGRERCVPRRDGVSVDGDEARVGLRHSHLCPGLNRSHLTRRSHGLGWVKVTSRSRRRSVARVAEVADGAGAE